MQAITRHQLAVLDAYARRGSVKGAAGDLEIGARAVRETLARVRTRYHVESTIEAYRAALVAGELRVEGLE